MIDVSKIEYKNHNERDVEVPALLEWARNKPEISSLLDVGACYSYYAYAQDLRNALSENSRYDGIDVLDCPKTASIVDNYMLGNVREAQLNRYDAVACISTIEHSGITSYKRNDVETEQIGVFEKICDITLKDFFISFPFGAAGTYPGEYSNITEGLLARFEALATERGFKIEAHFYYNEFPQGRLKWADITRIDAAKVPLAMDKGVQCVCLLTGSKE